MDFENKVSFVVFVNKVILLFDLDDFLDKREMFVNYIVDVI